MGDMRIFERLEAWLTKEIGHPPEQTTKEWWLRTSISDYWSLKTYLAEHSLLQTWDVVLYLTYDKFTEKSPSIG
jgi:hypothetical protein